jgi:hypothetical protein
VIQRGVVHIHDDPRQHGDCVVTVDVVVELHLEHVADLANGLGVEGVERMRLGLGIGIAHERQQAQPGARCRA